MEASTGRAHAQRAKRERRLERRRAEREQRTAAEAVAALRRAEALQRIQEAARRRRARHAANAACAELAGELDAAATLDAAIAARRRLAVERGRCSAAETELRIQLKDSESRFSVKWLPELRRSIEYRLLQEAIREDVEAERREERAASKTTRKMMREVEGYTGLLAYRCALSVLCD